MATRLSNLEMLASCISFVASAMIGLDCFVVAFVYSFPIVGVIPATVFGLGGFLLNWYVYHKGGVEALSEVFKFDITLDIKTLVIELLSFFGAVFVGLFVYSAYIKLLTDFIWLSIYITSPFVIGMSISIGVGTYILNKVALKDLWDSSLNESTEDPNSLFATHPNLANMIFTVLKAVGLLVTIFMTKTFYTGGLSVFPTLMPLIMVGAVAFSIGEFVFNYDQSLSLLRDQKDILQAQNPFTFLIPLFVVLIASNALGNAFITLELKPIAIQLLPLSKLICGCLQSAITMTNSVSQLSMENLDKWRIDGESTIYGTISLGILSASYLIHPTCSLLYIVLLFRNESQPTGSGDFNNGTTEKGEIQSGSGHPPLVPSIGPQKPH